MDAKVFKDYLKDRYHDQINWYDQKSIEFQKKYRLTQWMLIIFSSLTPLLILVDKLKNDIPWLSWIPVITSVLVAVLTAAIKTFRFQENWINYRTTCETLKKEEFLYNANVGDYSNTTEKETLFVERVESLISRENTLWLATQKSERSTKTQASGT